MIFNDLDLTTATDEELIEMEREHATFQLISMRLSKRLCSIEGREVLAEYELPGSAAHVDIGLSSYIQLLDEGMLDDRTSLINRKEKLLAHRNARTGDDAILASNNNALVESCDFNDITGHLNLRFENMKNPELADIKLRADVLHDAKLCVCYTN